MTNYIGVPKIQNNFGWLLQYCGAMIQGTKLKKKRLRALTFAIAKLEEQ